MEPSLYSTAVQVAEPASVAPVTLPDEPAPIDRASRITSIDTLRGFALLGILLMNIVAMGMYGAAYDDPTVYGGSTGPNLAVWAVLHVLAEGKMRCLFSLVFGASAVLLTSRLEQKGLESGDIYYRRTFWLLVFGVAHAYLLWLGDILYPYALCGLLLFPMRKLPAVRLLRIGAILVVLGGAGYVGYGFHQQSVIREGLAAVDAAKHGKKLTPEQEEAKSRYERRLKLTHPNAEELEKDKKAWRGSPLSVIEARGNFVGKIHGEPYYGPGSWDIWSMMFIGMGLMKLGVLSAKQPARVYWRMVLIGYGIGLPVGCYTAWLVIRSHFDPAAQAFTHCTYDLERLSIALGHLGLIMLLCQKGWLRWLTTRLGEVGQMAFSNYILQSVLTAFLFTGYGFRLYGSLQRYQLYYVVAGVWVVNLVFSHYWLQHYRFGPLEWCWRSLTYWKKQPMRLAIAAT